jgi:hypothetical protein
MNESQTGKSSSELDSLINQTNKLNMSIKNRIKGKLPEGGSFASYYLLPDAYLMIDLLSQLSNPPMLACPTTLMPTFVDPRLQS